MTKDELRKQVAARVRLDPAMKAMPESAIEAAMDTHLSKMHDHFQFDGRSILWLERQVRQHLHVRPAQ